MSDALKLFNTLHGILEFDLWDKHPNACTGSSSACSACCGGATIDCEEAYELWAKMDVNIYVDKLEDFRNLTDVERNMVVLRKPSVKLKGEAGIVVEHQAPNGKHFTLTDLVAAVVETERRTRLQSEWLDGIDAHHVYFEGVIPQKDGSWRICWGS